MRKYKDVYDTDREKDPFYDAVADKLVAPTEVNEVDRGLPTSIGNNGIDAAAPSNKEPDWFLREDVVNKMKAEELKDAIRRRGVVPKGKKGKLQDMLGEGKKCPSSRADLAKTPKHLGFSRLDRSGRCLFLWWPPCSTP